MSYILTHDEFAANCTSIDISIWPRVCVKIRHKTFEMLNFETCEDYIMFQRFFL